MCFCAYVICNIYLHISASRLVKTYGLNKILQEFEQDLIKLEKSGIGIVNLKTKSKSPFEHIVHYVRWLTVYNI